MIEYKIDSLGYYASTPDGKFRPIDIENGQLVIMRPKTSNKLHNNFALGGDENEIRTRTRRSSGRYSFGNRSSG